MNINDAYPSKYLKAADLGKARPVVTIANVLMEDVGDDRKPVVYFVGKDRALVLNKTNAQMIEEIAGTFETDNWRGVAIQLYATKTNYQGQIKDGIRVEIPRGGQGFSKPTATPFVATPITTTTAPAGFTSFAQSIAPAPGPVTVDDEDVPF